MKAEKRQKDSRYQNKVPGDKRVILDACDVIGSKFCISPKDGDVLGRKIARCLKRARTVAVSFGNARLVTTSFLISTFVDIYARLAASGQADRIEVVSLLDCDRASLQRLLEASSVGRSVPARQPARAISAKN